nr:dethiobiotin synthase [uncultured Cetobacterium sp.]
MTNNLKDGYFIIGTDTDIGKTYISALLFKSLLPENIGYYKPIQTGCEVEDNFIPLDPKFLCDFCEIDLKDDMTTYLFKNPLSPHLASEMEKILINPQNIIDHWNNMKKNYSTTIVEAAGGIFVPIIREKYHMFDLIKDLNIPVILVCSLKIGTINHTMLTIEFLKSKNIKIQGLIFNNYSDTFYKNDNVKTILDLSKIKNYLKIYDDQKIISDIEIKKFLK